jgi:hypothetical protein
MARYRNADISHLVRTGGAMTRVLADYPTDSAEVSHPGPRLRAISRALQDAGSPDSDIATMTTTLEQRSTNRHRTPRYLAIQDGVLLLDELLPATLLQSDEASFGALPALIPLILQRQSEVPYVILEASAGGGRIRTYLAGGADADERITGETEHLHKAHGGASAHFRHAHHTEEVWKRNETELADVVNQLLERHDVGLLVVTGDPHVVDLVTHALSSRAHAILATLASDTIAAGASAEELNVFLAAQLSRIVGERQAELIDRAAVQYGDGPTSDRRLEATVDALQQAAVETLLLDLEALAMDILVSLDREPWVAAVASETFGAEILGTVPAAEAMTRAAIATEAHVVIVEHGTLPGKASVAVIRR